MLECPARGALRAYGLEQARLQGVPEALYDRQIQNESGWQHCRADGTLIRSSGNAEGVCQIIRHFHPEVDPSDPWASLRYSTRLMAGHRQRYGSWRKALAAYNWGPAHVLGGRFDDGRGFGVQDHSPWDGTRDWRCAAGHGVSEQCKHYLDVILGPGWPEPTTTVDDGGGVGTIFETYRDPRPAGLYAETPLGFVFHGSRSGAAGNPKQKEYEGTARWEQTNPNGFGWQATIGEGRVAVHLEPTEWGWHALAASRRYIGLEFAQAVEGEPITDPQVTAAADYIKSRVLPVWSNIPLLFKSHPEVDRDVNGVNQGKSDAFAIGDVRMDELRTRVMAALGRGGEPMPVPDHTFVLGFADLAARLGVDVVGVALEDEHDAERAGHPIRHQRTEKGEMIYWRETNETQFYRAS